jgi:hypothetical protein
VESSDIGGGEGKVLKHSLMQSAIHYTYGQSGGPVQQKQPCEVQ